MCPERSVVKEELWLQLDATGPLLCITEKWRLRRSVMRVCVRVRVSNSKCARPFSCMNLDLGFVRHSLA